MSSGHSNRDADLPPAWERVPLREIAEINPGLEIRIEDDEEPVNFVPMRAVDPEGAGLLRPEVRAYGEVKKGYTVFRSGDVIMAKITPCMENGKTTVVPELPGSICFGSTEFHVIRPETGIDARWISNFLLQHEVRRVAQRSMAGGVGQMRVPGSFVAELNIPVPPRAEVLRIFAKLDELIPDLEAAVGSLENVQKQLPLYRSAVLKAAVEGKLTAEWREQHRETELASDLLGRLLAERRRLWEEEETRKFEKTGKELPKNWKARYREPVAPDIAKLPSLPEGWCWATVDQLGKLGSGQTPKQMPKSYKQTGSVSWFRVADMNVPGNEVWMVDGGVKFNSEVITLLGLRVFPAGSIIFPKRGGAIATNKKRRLKHDAACDLNLMVFTPDPDVAPYMWLWFQQLDLARLSDGSNVPQINHPDILPLCVPLPALAEIDELLLSAEDQLSVVEHIARQIEANLGTADALRQSTLRHAYAGLLVPQDQNDEPASELLKRIAAEREESARVAKAAKGSAVKSRVRNRDAASLGA